MGELLTVLVPFVDLAAVPVAAVETVAGCRDAADVVVDWELAEQTEGSFVAQLNDRRAVTAVFGDWEPDIAAVQRETAGMVFIAVLHFDFVDDLARVAVEFEEIAFLLRLVDGGDPERPAFDVYALDMVERALEGDGFENCQSGGQEEHFVTRW